MKNVINIGISSICISLLLLPNLLYAHGGEDHYHADEPSVPSTISPALSDGVRLELQSTDVELLGIVHDGKLTLYADQFATNAPLANAQIDLETKGQKLHLTTDANGVAEITAAWLAKPDRYEVTATIMAQGINDLLIGSVIISPPTIEATSTTTPVKPWWQFWGENTLELLFPSAYAHGGEEHSHEEPASPTVALPTNSGKASRLADGSVFMPKPAQRLLGIRTTVSQPQTVAKTLSLNASVINDPNASGQVQPTQSGRVLAPPAGFALLGSNVKKGQILAYLEPVTSNLDKGDRAEKVAQVQSELTLAEKNATRLESIAGVIPQMEVDAARTTVNTLKARLQALQSIPPQTQEILTAPIAGVISQVNVIAGQQANPGDILFTITDPSRLQIEALAYDPALLTQITGASALINGQTLELRYLGSSQQLKAQVLPLRFQISKTNAPLSSGQPLTITVQTTNQLTGIIVPATSIVNDSQQNPVVWVHTKAEQFVPYKVTTQTLDANRVVITQGLTETARVVTQGAILLSQVR